MPIRHATPAAVIHLPSVDRLVPRAHGVCLLQLNIANLHPMP
jgi:hypothetical protein